MNVILASAPNGVIGSNNKIPWDLPEDRKLFRAVTCGAAVVMGRRTWESLPFTLPGRTNVVMTSRPAAELSRAPHRIIRSLDELAWIREEIWLIGGARLVEAALGAGLPIKRMLISRVDKEYAGDCVFRNTFPYKIYQTNYYAGFHVLSYAPAPSALNNEQQYLALLTKILEQGKDHADRTLIGTRVLFGEQLRFDLRAGFPLLTTKKMAWKAIQEELFFFLAGKTNTKELEAKRIHIWGAHTSRAFLEGRHLDYDEGEMGPMYGAQWRNFNGSGIDQLKSVIEQIRKDPESRRILMTTFNPLQVEQGVLYPCHGLVLQFFCEDGYLSALMCQRSADAFLGLPFNIASYAALLHLVARATNMKPAELIISLGNVHLYSNQIEQAREQVARAPLAPPELEVTRGVELADFDRLDQSYLALAGYFYYPAIKAPLAV